MDQGLLWRKLLAFIELVIIQSTNLCGCNLNAVLLSIVEEIVTAGVLLEEFGVTPWSNDLDRRLDGVESELEADLVITLAGAAVTDSNTAFLLRDAHLRSGDDWSGQAGSEQVASFEDGVALDGCEAELLLRSSISL